MREKHETAAASVLGRLFESLRGNDYSQGIPDKGFNAGQLVGLAILHHIYLSGNESLPRPSDLTNLNLIFREMHQPPLRAQLASLDNPPSGNSPSTNFDIPIPLTEAMKILNEKLDLESDEGFDIDTYEGERLMALPDWPPNPTNPVWKLRLSKPAGPDYFAPGKALFTAAMKELRIKIVA